MGIDVAIFDDLHLSRLALTTLIEQCDDVTVVGSLESKPAALEFAELRRPDVMVISFDGRENETIEFAEKIATLPACRTLLLATECPRPVVRRAFTGGIDGILRRNDSTQRLFEAIHAVHKGERVFDAELTVAALVNEGCPLTLRQLSILEQLSCGDTVGEIAARLCLSEGTVRNYISSMVAKLGARNRIDALRIARDAYWI
ncbi:two component transcriptional regulator, LuxR family [Streptomyces sp. WMMB 714]|uniref:response regulator transcription factor n=1 Tax=Streptomyces sp. WMMB 714 TaxID=1286822 RepID=UPI0005F864DD|nr:response regulator transcription factor [Streptomyces sp. WMMB 714]SCK05227.1 two component transcriptional regulator, LuxR family [Streptomyces sp. WMMB 714]